MWNLLLPTAEYCLALTRKNLADKYFSHLNIWATVKSGLQYLRFFAVFLKLNRLCAFSNFFLGHMWLVMKIWPYDQQENIQLLFPTNCMSKIRKFQIVNQAEDWHVGIVKILVTSLQLAWESTKILVIKASRFPFPWNGCGITGEVWRRVLGCQEKGDEGRNSCWSLRLDDTV